VTKGIALKAGQNSFSLFALSGIYGMYLALLKRKNKL
jgi:hypothetical protein